MNRFFAVLMILTLSAKSETEGDWQYSVFDGMATITGYTGSGGAVTIPSEINGLPIVAIGNGYGSGYNNIFLGSSAPITSVLISDSVTDIGDQSFAGLKSLTNVITGTNVRSIGTFAFAECSALENINFPSSLTGIGDFAFIDCSLTNVILPSGVGSVGRLAFAYNRKLVEIFVPESVVQIGAGCFAGTPMLTNLVIPKKLTFLLPRLLDPGENELIPPSNANDLFIKNLSSALASNTNFMASLAQAIISASNNYGIATKADVGGAFTNGVQQVLTQPANYNLYTAQQVGSEVTAAQQDILNSPNSYDLYTTNQIHNLGLGGVILDRTNNQLVLRYQIMQSTDLQTWTPLQQNQLVIRDANENQKFLRVQALGQ